MAALMRLNAGLSPRVRGKRIDGNAVHAAIGSIPACAGEAVWKVRDSRRRRVYPRVCGGSTITSKSSQMAIGLSPRVRGKLRRIGAALLNPRSIPACAGEAMAPASRRPRSPVYPRVCGGSAETADAGFGGQGLSPRVRGKPYSWAAGSALGRSIPACAGEALTSMPTCSIWTVYPRVCGGSSGRRHHQRRQRRSIPACAGEAQGSASSS